jgi:Tfp pilus assembly protein PilX
VTAEEPGKPIRLSDDEVAYHVFLVKQVKEAQEAQALIAQTQGAWTNWADYLKGKYGFTDGDVITEEGRIVSGAQPASSS